MAGSGKHRVDLDGPRNSNGNIEVGLAEKLAGEDLANDVMKTEQRFSYSTISTATTTTVKSGTGFIQRIIVTGGTAGTIIIYDNTAGSGTQIANFDSTNAIATYEINAEFDTGLTIVTGAATKITVIYR